VQIMAAVQEFSEFTPDNDPHNEHDFGTVRFDAHTVNWKIDYYDPSLTYGSEDQRNESKTRRVLTIMLSEGTSSFAPRASRGLFCSGYFKERTKRPGRVCCERL